MAQVVEEKKEVESLQPSDASFPTTMKAIVCAEYGDPCKVLKLQDIPMVKPKDNELLIEIHSAALNPVDYKMVKGWMSILRKSFPWVVGRDFAGKVVKIGKKVKDQDLKEKGIFEGTFVCGMIDHFRNNGTFSEYIAIKLDYCEAVPIDKMNLNEAASIPLAAMTSYQAIMKKGSFKPGGKVLILGGSSGCGVYGIQIAKLYGASTITVTSSQEEFCKSLGADQVLNYKDESVPVWYEALKDEGYDVIFDCVGGYESWQNAHKILKKDGAFVTIVGDEQHGKPKSVMGFLGQGASMVNRKFWSLWGNPNYSQFLMDPVIGLTELMNAAKEGKMKAILDPTSPYQIDQFVEMFEKQMSHTAHGKLVLQIKDTPLSKVDDAGGDQSKDERNDVVEEDDAEDQKDEAETVTDKDVNGNDLGQ